MHTTKKTILVTGGAGFIGCNAAHYFSAQGWKVVIWDNLSRGGVEGNLEWLGREAKVDFLKIDLKDYAAVQAAMKALQPDAILHLAAQTAVTTSVKEPMRDFLDNALATFQLLEAMRQHSPQSRLIYASTNKVYGELDWAGLHETQDRYILTDHSRGIDESAPLDFHSPYGCSKGAADQYVVDYGRIYGLQTVVLRQSCIYGPRQFGVEDQGWVAWFVIASLLGRGITVFGDGKQVRDLLYVCDLCELYDKIFSMAEWPRQRAYNVGGGNSNSRSLLEFIEELKNLGMTWPEVGRDGWRPGDQKVFISDNTAVMEQFGWSPTVMVPTGLRYLVEWVRGNMDEIRRMHG